MLLVRMAASGGLARLRSIDRPDAEEDETLILDRAIPILFRGTLPDARPAHGAGTRGEILLKQE